MKEKKWFIKKWTRYIIETDISRALMLLITKQKYINKHCNITHSQKNMLLVTIEAQLSLIAFPGLDNWTTKCSKSKLWTVQWKKMKNKLKEKLELNQDDSEKPVLLVFIKSSALEQK